jgi:hypothetical protein
VTGKPLNVRLRITAQYAFDKEGFNVQATLRETVLPVERIRDFETGPDTLGVKLGIPNSADLYPGEATLRVCVNTQSSVFGVGAFGCGTLQVQIIR